MKLLSTPVKYLIILLTLFFSLIAGIRVHRHYITQQEKHEQALIDEAFYVHPVTFMDETTETDYVEVEFTEQISENSAFVSYYHINAPTDAIIMKDSIAHIDLRIVEEYINQGDTIVTEKKLIQNVLVAK